MRKDKIASGMGTVCVDPEGRRVVVGRRYVVDITYTAGPDGIEIGGALRFKLPGLIVGSDDRGPVSCSNPQVRWTCSNHLPEINGKLGREFPTLNYLFVVLREARLNEGDTVTVRYGAATAQPTAAPQWAQNWPVEVAVDVDGSRAAPGSGFYLVENPPVLTFVSDRPHRMEVFVPSRTGVNEPFRTVIRLLDRYNNLVEDCAGTVTLEAHAGGELIHLGEHAFEPRHRGVLTVDRTQFKMPGIHRIMARHEALGIYARSNPTKTTQDGKGGGVFWGDTHCHSRISADTSAINPLICSPAQDYDYARNRSALDFCMVTDHIEDHIAPDWAETRRAAREAYEAGRFVSFSAFEATYQPLRGDGDKNVYFLEDDEAWVNSGTTEELYDHLKQRRSKALVIPHLHVQTNWDRHDPELERVVEVYSHWGCGLSPDSDPPIIPGAKRRPESYVHHALDRGAKLGFIASADHSYGHPGDDFWWELSNYNGGLAAIYAPALTRPGIWEGLWYRRCYGTTRARILLEFELNGHRMGEEFVLGNGTRELAINVYGTSAIAAIEIVKNGRILQRFPGEGRLDLELTYSDSAAERETDYYYVHVLQEDSEQAWSSPVWVSRGANREETCQ